MKGSGRRSVILYFFCILETLGSSPHLSQESASRCSIAFTPLWTARLDAARCPQIFSQPNMLRSRKGDRSPNLRCRDGRSRQLGVLHLVASRQSGSGGNEESAEGVLSVGRATVNQARNLLGLQVYTYASHTSAT